MSQPATSAASAAPTPVTSAAPVAPPEEEIDPNAPPQGVDLSGATSVKDDVPKYRDDDEAFLFGKTDRPNEPIRSGIKSNRAPAPEVIYRYLPDLLEAASDPDAPQELHAFLRLLQHHLEA